MSGLFRREEGTCRRLVRGRRFRDACDLNGVLRWPCRVATGSTQGLFKQGRPMPEVALVRGDVVFVDLTGAVGTEKQGRRPCVVIQNDGGNRVSPLTIVAPLTDSAHQGRRYPQQVLVDATELGDGGKGFGR